mmetsp:Transcript_53509/g.148360  ORF Transcript_53509/g.148360 Transcript_53509/m.148360 type:complete len:469 (-) Transcript_53509:127-1533(-)|eukprot:CAMPEP_0179097012 /NCGR_PEP_ID=MMETSP0796-20121207/44626_1 /TAXON_ID=73915 /ORGANISM="Pyrodinium bahamense, Strain pbaha01" /LENGTH=468 /DNA_ID=CAMNT_0020794741 /DNA_START=58 /DNA_END=1467 /DNA_ORIENTATION=-
MSVGAAVGALARFFKPEAAKKDGTTLVELTIQDITDAHHLVGERPDGFTPVSIIPQSSMATCCCCCPLCYVSIPEGFTAIVTKFGAVVEGDAEDGTWSPGCHCFWPLYQVDKLVSRQLIIFDVPLKDCKTKDAISVNLDVLMVFEITNARSFIYDIGPAKLDDLLRASQDESLRQMAFETDIEHIYDLHGANTQHIVDEMNDTKFNKFGVHIHEFTVKNVTLPEDMSNDMQEKTLFDTKTSMQHMKQSYDRQHLNNEEGKQKLREECDNMRMAAEQQAEVVKNQAIKVTSEVMAQTSRQIAEKEASKNNEAQQLMATANFEVSKMKSQILAVQREINSKTQAECGRILAEAEAFAKKQETEAKIEVAAKIANGKRALGEAEGVASAAFAARRANEAELKRMDILEQVVTRSDCRIATSQENTLGMSYDNSVVTQVAQQGLEALRSKLAEVTASSLSKLQQVKPPQLSM